MIGILVSIFTFAFVAGYILLGLFVLPYGLYTSIKDGTFFEEGTIYIFLIFLIILIILIVFAVRIGKNSSAFDYISSLKVFMGISIPVYYVVLLLISLIVKEQSFLDILLFRDDFWSCLEGNISLYCMFTTIPSIIASAVAGVFAKRNIKKQVELEAARAYIENENKKQAEQTSKTIEYYKKLEEIKRLLDSGTITKDKFEKLKLDLMIQYNIDEE